MVFAVLISRGLYVQAMFVVVVPALIRLMLGPQDDVWTFVFVMASIGTASWGFIDQMGRPRGSPGLGLWLSIAVAAFAFIAELWRFLRHRL